MPVVFPYTAVRIFTRSVNCLPRPRLRRTIFSYTTLLRGRKTSGFSVIGTRRMPTATGIYREKALSFLNILAANTDYVLVDCMSEPEDSILTQTALATSDSSVRW